MQNIPVRPYIITAYHDKLGMSIKQYAIIKPGRILSKPFKFDTIFPGYHPPSDEEGDEEEGESSPAMNLSLEVEGDFEVDGMSANDLKLKNDSDFPVTIDKIKVVWSGSTNSQKVKKIYIDGVEIWSGSKRSNQTIDISDYTVSADSEDIPIRFDFSTDLDGKVLELTFTMSDGTEPKVQ